jgi:hypothetical protein
VDNKELKLHINKQTAKMSWKELERAYAQGRVIYLDPTLDMIDTAVSFINDDKVAIESYTSEKKLWKVCDEQAGLWAEKEITFWSVCIPPFVLIQESATG